ncbi:MAG: phospholipase [Acidobacteria bacterium]|nr:MAG: phospholipase [Acidobacteriota bacterium]
MLTFRSAVDNSDQPYAIYVPSAYGPEKKYPLVVSLHAANSNHRINLARVLGRGAPDAIVAAPHARGTMGYQGIPETDVYDVLADVKRRYSVDDDRVYLTGPDMGGGGALWLGLTRPDLWAAVAPVCAIVPPEAEPLAPNALNLPVHLFHGDEDPLAPVESARGWHKRLLSLGAHAEYAEYPGVRHNAWDFAYRNGAIFDWFAKFRRDRMPARVRFHTRAYKYDRAYWVRIDGLTPGAPASIDVRFTGKNRIEAAVRDLGGFTLSLAGHPQFSETVPLTVVVDGETLRHKGAAASFRRTAKGWAPGRYEPPPGAKRPGSEGPLREAIAARHLYVYGSGDSRDIAMRAAEWSSPRAKLLLTFAVKADRDVTAEELAGANLVLFGTAQTNSLIARLAPHLPLELNPGAADYGLVFLAPAAGRYIVVNSGLPWWTGAEALPWQVLQRFGDYVLFKKSLAHIVAEGRFTQDWKLPAEAARKLQATGTVVVHR